MSYLFVENKYYPSDTNIDINFNNDILYSDLLNNYANNDITPLMNNNQIPNNDFKKINKQYISNTYISLITIIIIIIFLIFITIST
jgi:ATP-dependent Zn protease